MTRNLFNKDGKLISQDKMIPKCGEDFCDTCGDCLHCYGGEPDTCTNGDGHVWVVYEEDLKENAPLS